MGFFSDHWVLWTCFFVPALFWLAVADYRRLTSPQGARRLKGADAARVVVWISGTLLVIAAIHVIVGLIVP